jgi:hypothetical protein
LMKNAQADDRLKHQVFDIASPIIRIASQRSKRVTGPNLTFR